RIAPDEKKRVVTLRPAINGVTTCIYDGTARVALRTEGPSCRLALGDFEIDGDLPVSLRKGGATVDVISTGGACALNANVKSGGMGPDRATFELTPPPADNDGRAGDSIGVAAIERGGALTKLDACTRVKSISNGKCEAINAAGYAIPDGDCFTDFE